MLLSQKKKKPQFPSKLEGLLLQKENSTIWKQATQVNTFYPMLK